MEQVTVSFGTFINCNRSRQESKDAMEESEVVATGQEVSVAGAQQELACIGIASMLLKRHKDLAGYGIAINQIDLLFPLKK